MSKLILHTHADKLILNDKQINVVKEIERIAWGGITGNLSDQTDLNEALENKADNADIDALNIALDLVINDLDNLSNEVDTKASAAAVVQALSTKADLVNGLIPASQLPSYVDDVLVFPTWVDFPVVGEVGKIYVTEDTNKTYRWSGSGYVVIADSVALGETAATAYRGDRGKIAFDHSQSQGNPHNATTSDINEGNKLYFTEDRVRQSVLTGLNTSIATPVVATDNVLQAVGKIQGQINKLDSIWVDAATIGYEPFGRVNFNYIYMPPLQFARINGMLWVRGGFYNSLIQTGVAAEPVIFIITDINYKVKFPYYEPLYKRTIALLSVRDISTGITYPLNFTTSRACVDAATAAICVQKIESGGELPQSAYGKYLGPFCLGELVIK